MGYYCWLCDRVRPNESFSHSGRRLHECRRCSSTVPRARRAQLRLLRDLEHVLFRQSNISPRNIAWVESLATHEDDEVRALAAIVAEIGRVHPHRRRRYRTIRQKHRKLWQRMIAAGLVTEWFGSDYGDVTADEPPFTMDEPWSDYGDVAADEPPFTMDEPWFDPAPPALDPDEPWLEPESVDGIDEIPGDDETRRPPSERANRAHAPREVLVVAVQPAEVGEIDVRGHHHPVTHALER